MNTQPTAEQARAELARLTQNAADLEAKTTEALAAFEASPSAKLHADVAVFEQKTKNARKALETYELEVRDILAADALEKHRLRFEELMSQPGPIDVVRAAGARFVALADSVRGELNREAEELRRLLREANARAREAQGLANTIGAQYQGAAISLTQGYELINDAATKAHGEPFGHNTSRGSQVTFSDSGSLTNLTITVRIPAESRF